MKIKKEMSSHNQETVLLTRILATPEIQLSVLRVIIGDITDYGLSMDSYSKYMLQSDAV